MSGAPPSPPVYPDYRQSAPGGSGAKWAWILVGCLVFGGLGGVAILAAILFPVFSQARQAAKRTSTMTNMKQLAVALSMYTDEHGGLLPPRMESTAEAKPALMPYVQAEASFRSENPDGREFDWNGSLAGKKMAKIPEPGRVGFASDSKPWRGRGGRVVGFLDGSSRYLNAETYDEGRKSAWLFRSFGSLPD